MEKIELREGPIVEGPGIFGPLMECKKGPCPVVGMSTLWIDLAEAQTHNGTVLVHNGPERKPMFVTANSLKLATMRNE